MRSEETHSLIIVCLQIQLLVIKQLGDNMNINKIVYTQFDHKLLILCPFHSIRSTLYWQANVHRR